MVVKSAEYSCAPHVALCVPKSKVTLYTGNSSCPVTTMGRAPFCGHHPVDGGASAQPAMLVMKGAPNGGCRNGVALTAGARSSVVCSYDQMHIWLGESVVDGDVLGDALGDALTDSLLDPLAELLALTVGETVI